MFHITPGGFMKFNPSVFSAILAVAAVSSAASISLAARASEWNVDAAHSNVGFTVRHLVSKVSGGFTDFSGKISFDDKKPEDTKVAITVKSASINTANSKRDDHLRSADFFDAAKYPTLSFTSTKITSTGASTYKLEGNQTLHGVTKPAVYNVEFLGAAKDPEGKTRAGFSATSKINRKDYGLAWSKIVESTPMVGDEVEITLQFEAVNADSLTKAAPKK